MFLVRHALQVVVVLLSLARAVPGQEVIRQHRGPNYLWQDVRLADPQLDLKWVRDYSLARAAEHPELRFLQVRFCHDDYGCDRPSFSSHMTYEGHLWFYRRAVPRLRTQVIAEVMFIQGEGILRARDEVGRVYSELLGQKDPLQVQTPYGAARILWIEYYSGLNSKVADGASDEDLHVYLASGGDYKQEFAESVLSEIQKKLEPIRTSVGIDIRPKPWFLMHGSFPSFYPFDAEFAEYTQDEVMRWPSASCDNFYAGWEMRCNGLPLEKASGTDQK